MAQGIERFSAPPPGEDFDATDEARFRRLIEQFMENADYRVRDVGDDVESLDSRITALEGAADEGAWRHIETLTASDDATLDFTGFLDAACRDYVFVLSHVIPATDDVEFRVLTSTDGGSNWDTGASDYHYNHSRFGAELQGGTESTGAAFVRLHDGVGAASGEDGVCGTMHLFFPAGGLRTRLEFSGSVRDSGAGLDNSQTVSQRLAAEDVDGVRFLFSSGNVESGQISLYGIKDS